jgi:hypothetical protein
MLTGPKEEGNLRLLRYLYRIFAVAPSCYACIIECTEVKSVRTRPFGDSLVWMERIGSGLVLHRDVSVLNIMYTEGLSRYVMQMLIGVLITKGSLNFAYGSLVTGNHFHKTYES